jgi:glycosyltransferase involved in cell wall biosynthesis
MILFLHNHYRVQGGEERAVEELMWLVRSHLGEPAELLARGMVETDGLASARARIRIRAGVGLLWGGLDPREVEATVRRTKARVVHAHNLSPTLGWRALAAARRGGAGVVLHLHQYRLVCAVGVCFTRGEECVRCHGRNTLPGIVRNCRGSYAEALAYGAGLALWQRRIAEQADALVVPSEFARERLRALEAPLAWERMHVLAPPLRALAQAPSVRRSTSGGYALVVARRSPEKGIDVAIEACRRVGIPLVIAGAGGDAGAPNSSGGTVRFVGHVDDARLSELRAGAAVAVVPSRSSETFGLAAAEAMATGLPVAGSRVGALPELIEEDGLAPPGDAAGLAAAIERVCADPRAGERALARVRAICSPELLAGRLAAIYAGASELHYPPS